MTVQVSAETWLLGFGNGFLWQGVQSFSSIFAFLAYLMIWRCNTLKNHQISPKNSSKNEEKPSSNCIIKSFLADTWYPKIQFRVYPIRHYDNSYTYTSPHEAVHFILNQGMDGICVTQLTQIGFCHDLAIWRTLLAKQYFSMLSK